MLDLLLRLPERGFSVEVVVPAAGPMVDLLAAKGIRHHLIPFKTWLSVKPRRLKAQGRWWLNQVNAGRLARRLGDADLVYTNSIWSPFGALVAERLGRPHVWHFRELVSTTPGRQFAHGDDFSRRLIARTTRFCVGNSRFVCDGAKAYCPPDRVRLVLTAPLDAQSPLPFMPYLLPGPAEPVRMVIVGTVQVRKGQLDAVRAVAALHARGVPAELEIVGGGGENYRARVREEADRLGVSGQVHWTGKVKDVGEVLRRSHVSLTCSTEDPIPRTTIEAMAVGLPVVAAESGGVPEIIDDGETGLLVPPNDPEAIASAVQGLLASHGRTEHMRRRAYETVYRRFDGHRYADEMVALFEEAVR